MWMHSTLYYFVFSLPCIHTRTMQDNVATAHRGAPSFFTELVMRGDMEEAKQRLEKGADPDAKDPSGKTAMQYAVMNHDTNMVQMLLAYGANPNVTPSSETAQLMDVLFNSDAGSA
jgi:ankyrin repeat protein